MKLNLESLYRNMCEQNKNRCKYNFEFLNKEFHCIFAIDNTPWKLYVFTLGIDPILLEVSVRDNFTINTFIENSVFTKLCKYLELKFDPNKKFKPVVLFEALNKSIPAYFKQNPAYHETLMAAPNIEEADKIYFVGTHFNPNDRRVTTQNYRKTSVAFGDKIAEKLKQSNISTCWSANPNDENRSRLSEILSRYN